MANERFRHYKGTVYQRLGTARHSETEEELIVYVAEDNPGQWWVRPKDMFYSNVEVDGREVKRFNPIIEEASSS